MQHAGKPTLCQTSSGALRSSSRRASWSARPLRLLTLSASISAALAGSFVGGVVIGRMPAPAPEAVPGLSPRGVKGRATSSPRNSRAARIPDMEGWMQWAVLGRMAASEPHGSAEGRI
jgi:hypothetical protein